VRFGAVLSHLLARRDQPRRARSASASMPIATSMSWAVRSCSRASRRRPSWRSHSRGADVRGSAPDGAGYSPAAGLLNQLVRAPCDPYAGLDQGSPRPELVVDRHPCYAGGRLDGLDAPCRQSRIAEYGAPRGARSPWCRRRRGREARSSTHPHLVRLTASHPQARGRC
jgi:hypothetical protein